MPEKMRPARAEFNAAGTRRAQAASRRRAVVRVEPERLEGFRARTLRATLAAFAALAAAVPATARAEGFATHDLAPLAAPLAAALGAGATHRGEAGRVILACPACDGAPMLDIRLGRQTDGTEQRVRSGETPIARLDALCKAREPACVVTALDVAPAVGWISAWPSGSMRGATAVVLKDGDLLTLRALAATPQAADAAVRAALATVRPRLLPR